MKIIDGFPTIFLTEIPNCNYCAEFATHDGKTTTTGLWAYMCDYHFQQFGSSLGLGRGQKIAKIK